MAASRLNRIGLWVCPGAFEPAVSFSVALVKVKFNVVATIAKNISSEYITCEYIYVTIFFRNRRQVHTFGLDIPLYLSGFRGFGYDIFSVTVAYQ